MSLRVTCSEARLVIRALRARRCYWFAIRKCTIANIKHPFIVSLTGVLDGVVVIVLDCQSRGRGFKTPSGQKFASRFLLHLHSLTNSAILSTLTLRSRWEDETARERIGHPLAYTKAKKMKSLTLHTHGCLRTSLKDCSSLLLRRTCLLK